MEICCVKCRRPDYNGNFALPMCEDMLCECHCPINKEIPPWEAEFEKKFVYFVKTKGNRQVKARLDIEAVESIKDFIRNLIRR